MKSKRTTTTTRGKRTMQTERAYVDLARVDATTADDIERHAREDDEAAWTPEMLTKARIFYPSKPAITIRVHPRVLAFFKREGRGYQSRINAALLAYVDAHERKAS
ncbi:MAG TPA: BrnA antitoxin family protein [Gemmatimonadaceae bacterium]|jgi:uncharacterized protein (DUF4415 family)|nr:BrnA antitoxin family protein [Gemmatimonadaceae bacterium]